MKNTKSVGLLVPTLLLGAAVFFVALYVGVGILGPAVRATFGEPFGYGQDYATRQAWLQATAVRVLSVAVAFVLLGVVLGAFGVRRRWSATFAIANPISACIGYALYQRMWSGEFAGEYFGYVGMAVMALFAPLVFAPCIMLGMRAAGQSRR